MDQFFKRFWGRDGFLASKHQIVLPVLRYGGDFDSSIFKHLKFDICFKEGFIVKFVCFPQFVLQIGDIKIEMISDHLGVFHRFRNDLEFSKWARIVINRWKCSRCPFHILDEKHCTKCNIKYCDICAHDHLYGCDRMDIRCGGLEQNLVQILNPQCEGITPRHDVFSFSKYIPICGVVFDRADKMKKCVYLIELGAKWKAATSPHLTGFLKNIPDLDEDMKIENLSIAEIVKLRKEIYEFPTIEISYLTGFLSVTLSMSSPNCSLARLTFYS